MDTEKAQKVLNKNIEKMREKGNEIEKAASEEYKKVKKQMDETSKKVGDFIKKNPAKAALISAGIGAALGTAVSLLLSGKNKKKKK